MANKEMIPD